MFFLSAAALAAEQNVTKIITCSLPGEGGKEASFFIDNITKGINYGFKRNGKTELKVVFNEGNKLRRTKARWVLLIMDSNAVNTVMSLM